MSPTPRKVQDIKSKKLPRNNFLISHDDSICESSTEDDFEWIYENAGTDEKPSIRVTDSDLDEISMIPAKIESNPVKGKRKIVGARNKKIQIRIGDTVSVNCGDPVPWVAIISSFDKKPREETSVNILWLSKNTDISNKQKKRKDFLPNELYLTPLKDTIRIGNIIRPVELMSEMRFNQKFPNENPRRLSENGSVFICRRGCEPRGAVYTEEFVWEDIKPQNEHEVDDLYERIKAETKIIKKKAAQKRSLNKEDEKQDEMLVTPRKKQKFSTLSPRKLKTPSKLITPSHKRVMIKKPLEFTPLGTRYLDFDHVASSPFQTARSRLHVSSVPGSLPCREDEFASVYSHLEAAIIEGTGTCIYISGTPGTGKTATVRQVVAQLQASVQADELDSFNFVEINGMKITDPVQSYSILWEALKGERISPIHALDLLEREFTHPSPRRTPCVVLMDELDQLVTKNQLVMYNFFNWPGLRHSRLIVLAVANTMDLPERTLSNKISSRLGLTRITFPGYSFDQLVTIITSRLEGVPGNIVEKDAIEFASRKVAAVSGDARRVLDICRRAVELAESDSVGNPNPTTPTKTPGKVQGVGKVKIETIRRAIKEATTSPLQNYLRELPLSAKLLLVALVVRMRRNGVSEDTLGEVLDEVKKTIKQNTSNQRAYEFLLTKQHVHNIKYGSPRKHTCSPPRVLAMGLATITLMEAGIVVLEARRTDRTGKIRLCIGDEDIKIAFKDDPEVKSLGF